MDQGLSIIDQSDPRSVIRMAPTSIQEALVKLEEEHPDWIGVSEQELIDRMGGNMVKIPPSVHIMRMNFWNEYNRATLHGKPKMEQGAITDSSHYTGVFYRAIKNPRFLAWIVCIPDQLKHMQEEGLYAAMRELRSILDIPNTNSKGQVNTKVLEMKVKVYALLDARIHGGFTQKVENKTLNINTNMKDVVAGIQQVSAEELDKRLEQFMAAKEKKEQAKLKAPDIEVEGNIVGSNSPAEN